MKIRRLRTLAVALGLSLISALVAVALYLTPDNALPTANRIEDFVALNDALFWVKDHKIDQALHLHLPDRDEVNEKLILVTIDEASLKETAKGGLGAWPWDRRIFGKMLTRLGKAGAAAVAFDVVFLEGQPQADPVMAQGMKKVPTLLPFTVDTTAGGALSINPVADTLRPYVAASGYTTVDNVGGWLTGQPASIESIGPDGKILDRYTSLAAATVGYVQHRKMTLVNPWEARFGDETIPLDGTGKMLMIPFLTNEFVQQAGSGVETRAGAAEETMRISQTIPFVQAYRDLSDDDLKSLVQGAIVVIGTTSQAQGDFVVTPNGRFPGVFSNLRFMDQLLTHKYVRRVPVALDITLLVIMPLLVGFVVTQLRPSIGVAVSLALVLAYTAVATGVYAYTLSWLNLVQVDAAMVVAALFVALFRTITEGADKRAIREMFGKHVSPALVTEMLAHDDPKKALQLSGKRVKVTIFYSDIRGFTAMSENMTPEQIYGQLNEYFEEMCKIVFKYDGYVDKFIGDCLMAVHSAPNPHPDDAKRAVLSAIEQQDKILEMAAKWAGEGRPAFTVGMGLNTGEVVMGNLGSSSRLNYTVIGDNVNTAARLYNVAKGGQTIISETTYEEVKDLVVVNELPPVLVKGKVKPLRIFEVIRKLDPGEENPSTLLDQSVEREAVVAADH